MTESFLPVLRQNDITGFSIQAVRDAHFFLFSFSIHDTVNVWNDFPATGLRTGLKYAVRESLFCFGENVRCNATTFPTMINVGESSASGSTSSFQSYKEVTSTC